jgi:prepilin-type processing-associated H-X9-DG protein
MKQLSMGLFMYVKDWDETYPPAGIWADGITKYSIAESSFHCLSAQSPFSYALNRGLAGRSQYFLTRPADTVLLFEIDARDRNAEGDEHTARAIRHSGASNMAFADGHEKWINEYASAKVKWRP